MALKQTFAAEGKELRRKAGGYAEPGRTTVLRTVCARRRVGPAAQRGLQGHAKQFKRLRKVVKRQRTILGVVMREVQAPSWTHRRRLSQPVAPRRWSLQAFWR